MLKFNDSSGKENDEISGFYNAINSALGDKLYEADRLHEKGIPIEEYIDYQKQIETEKSSFLNSYCERNPVSARIKSVLQSEIKFKTAHAIINYRFDYSQKYPRLRQSLPKDFYTNLFKEYSIQSFEDIQPRVSIDYISNIVSVLSSEAVNLDDKISYFESFSIFSPTEIDLLYKLYKGETNISDTAEFKEFMKINRQKIIELNMRFNVKLLFKNIALLGSDLTRDLVISQGITRYYFETNLQPTLDEWKQIENNISNKSILNYLKEYGKEETSTFKKNEESIEQETIAKSTEEVVSKYIDKYEGKVIYVDFYATWCGPCREEIPYAKQLYKEFENKDVVFLNLCANSKKEDWENLKKQHNLEGENYLLTNEEFYLLSRIYDVKGFPTYLLIDKNGNVSDYNTLRPSDKKNLYKKIDDLLNQ